MSTPTLELIGVGNPIMDLLAPVHPEFLDQHVAGEKGGMVLVDDTDIVRLVSHLGAQVATAPGGSAANTTIGAARLGLRTAFLGKIGNDATAENYFRNFTATGGDGSRFKRGAIPNGRCLSLVTADGQRTMRTHLGAAMTLSPDEITVADFQGCRHAHVEGYLMFNPALAEKVMATARAAGCTLSLDLASFEVVGIARDWIFNQLRQGVQVVFANEDEARTLFQRDTTAYDELARELAKFGGIAAVKLGKDGAWVAQGRDLHRIAPVRVEKVVDTTGAGDAWAAGYLFGHLRGHEVPDCGALGSLLGAETVRHLGAAIPDLDWPGIRHEVAELLQR